MKDCFDITGKVALVTGASSGLGAEFSKICSVMSCCDKNGSFNWLSNNLNWRDTQVHAWVKPRNLPQVSLMAGHLS